MSQMIRRIFGLVLICGSLLGSDEWQAGTQAALNPPFKVPTENDTIIRNSGPMVTGNGDLRLGFEVNRVIAKHEVLPTHTDLGELKPSVVTYMTQAHQLSSTVKFKLFLHFDSTNVLDRGKLFNIQVVSFNGVGITKTYTGQIGAWRRIEVGLEIPISLLRSGRYQGWDNGQPIPPVAGLNELVLRTDMEDHMEIDPATGTYGTASGDIHGYLGFGAIAPLIFIHGTNADQTSWEPAFWTSSSEDNVVGYLKDSNNSIYFPWEYRISLSMVGTVDSDNDYGNGSIDDDASELAIKIPLVLKAFGAQACHLIGHSKGGMSIRQLAFNYNNNNNYINFDKTIKLLSLWNIGTPNKGTILSDIVYQSINIPYWFRNWVIMDAVNWSGMSTVLKNSAMAAHWTSSIPKGRALADQQTSRMVFRDINIGKNPMNDLYYVAGDADWCIDGNPPQVGGDYKISFTEGKELLNPGEEYLPGSTLAVVWLTATSMYRTLGHTRAVDITYNRIFNDVFIQMHPVGNEQFIGNDMVTTVTNAQPYGGESVRTERPPDVRTNLKYERGNHSSIKNGALVRAILNKIMSSEKYQPERIWQ